jgi:uncharacterized protein (UPF0332 family)
MLKDKSVRNLQAGEALSALGLVDPAASRYYYAMYQAAVHRFAELGLTPGRIRSGAVEWDHSMVLNNIFLVRGQGSDRDVYRAMREMRRIADYDADAVDPRDLAARIAAVREFVKEAAR